MIYNFINKCFLLKLDQNTDLSLNSEQKRKRLPLKYIRTEQYRDFITLSSKMIIFQLVRKFQARQMAQELFYSTPQTIGTPAYISRCYNRWYIHKKFCTFIIIVLFISCFPLHNNVCKLISTLKSQEKWLFLIIVLFKSFAHF